MALVEPTRPQNAYWIWLSEHREAIVKECGSAKGSVVGKLAGDKWKALSADAKKPWEAKAATSKAAYEKAMEEFKAAGGEPGKRRQEKKDAKQARVDKKEKKEARKASGMPKRPPSAFWLWQVENREALIKEAGTNKIPVIGKLAGEKWGKLSASAKAPFEKRAAEAKAEYVKAMAEWKATNPDGGDQEEGEENEGEQEESTKTTEPLPAKKARVEPSSKTEARPKAKGKAKPKGKPDDAAKTDEIDATVLKSAQDMGLETALRNLAQRDEIKARGHSADKMLKALQNAGGLVNKAKAALLAGA